MLDSRPVLRNGLYFIAHEAALRAEAPLARRYRASVILGSLREDVIRVPVLGFTEYASFSHFGGRGLPGGYLPLLWPGPISSIERLYSRATRHAAAGKAAAAFVTLGRAAHVLSDVCIPSHVHRAAHDRDPFEWWVEGNLPKLEISASSSVSSSVSPPSPADLVRRLASRAARHLPDRTNTPLGRVFKRRGFRQSVDSALAKQQALELIPAAIEHVRALLEHAADAMPKALVSSHDMADEDEVLAETLDALDLPERMLQRWFDHNRAFCDQHGGRRVYPGLLELLDRCDRALSERGEKQGKAP
jgi:hypothetical protein